MQITTAEAPAAGIVIYGPPGCGKTRYASALAKHFGKARIVDGWQPGGPVLEDTLALTNEYHPDAIPFTYAIAALTAPRLRLVPCEVKTASTGRHVASREEIIDAFIVACRACDRDIEQLGALTATSIDLMRNALKTAGAA